MEDRRTEYKREYTDAVKYTVVAFANTEGGELYLGVDDNGHACGLADPDGTMLRLTNLIRDAIRPDVTMFTSCDYAERDGKTVIVVTVMRGTARPYYLAGKGIRPEGVYVRQGSSSVPASEALILQMIRETGGDSYEDTRSLEQHLTFREAEDYFGRKGVEFGESQMRTLGMIGADGTYTNLAMLLSDQCSHTLKLARFDGSAKTVFRDRRELSGSLFRQLEEAYEYLDGANSTRAEFAGLERIDRRDYPEEALREALLNAMVHRDYSYSGPTLISVFDDRIEVVSIGGLMRGITLEDIFLGISVLRNPKLAGICYRLRLIEAYGTGILKIRECYADFEQQPLIEATDHAFKITLPNRNYAGNRTVPEQGTSYSSSLRAVQAAQVLQMLESKESITRREVETQLGVSQQTAGIILRAMVESGALVKVGGGKKLAYRKGKR